MLVNGLLLTLSPDHTLVDEAIQRIAAHDWVRLAPREERWQALAVETPDVKAAHDFHEWLESLPGIEQVDVTYVAFDEPTPILPVP